MNVLSNLLEDDYQSAEGSFDKILSMYETKLTYERIKSRLQEKTERFGESTKIVSSDEFQRVNEIKDQLVAFLKENSELIKSAGMKTGMKLVSLVSTSFDLPKRTVDQLQEAKEIEVSFVGKTNLYEHLCRKELIQKELLEAKQNFGNIWANCNSVQDLASMVFESDTDSIREQVALTITEAPYLALATKKQIVGLLQNSLSLNEAKVTQKELNSFAGKVHEMKKPAKQYVLDVLNEKYWIDVRKLDEIPTFKTLLMNESDIVKQIASHASEGSILQKTLSELANVLNTRNGAEAIDLAVFLEEVFNEAGYGSTLNEASLMDYMDFTKVADDLGKIGQVLKMLVPAVEKAAEELEDEAEEEALDKPEEMDSEDPLGTPDELDSNSEVPVNDADKDAEEAAEKVKAEVKDEEAEAKDDQPDEDQPEEEEEGDDEEEEMDQDDLTSLLSKLEDLLSDIKPDEDEEEDKKKDPEQYKT